ncbi:DUF3630 family protein [Ralstonia solanacearum]|uniref:DUF3630 family protein n=1 Tax=Ralstonia solanacearum TaxID=305 RepID=UPI003D80255B
MKATIETSPTGFRYIAILEPVDWDSAPKKAREILDLIGALDVATLANDDSVSVDTKWWNFTFKEKIFRIVYEEWPNGLSIEPRDAESASLLPDMERLILAA